MNPVSMDSCFMKVLGRVLLTASILVASAARADIYTPLVVTGFNQDLVANGQTATALASTTAAMDTIGFVFYEAGFPNTSGTTQPLPSGLPTNRSLASVATPGARYSLADYTGNNALYLTNQGDSGTLTLGTPGSYGKLALLAASGDGSGRSSGPPVCRIPGRVPPTQGFTKFSSRYLKPTARRPSIALP